MSSDEDGGRTPVGPKVPVPDDDESGVVEACADDRDLLTPKETATCAGVSLVEQYENEEDGGS